MGITRLRPDEQPIHAMTTPLTSAPSVSQVFDLGQIRVAYVEVTLLSQNPDTLTVGLGAGEIYWRVYNESLVQYSPHQSRDGITYTQFDADFTGGDYFNPVVPLPVVVLTAKGVVTRYLKFELVAWDVTAGAVYAGAQNPTADWSVYVEYV